MNATIKTTTLTYLNDDADVAAYAQYGRPAQACYYPNLRKWRAKLARRLEAKGVNLNEFNGYTVDFNGALNTGTRFGVQKLATPVGRLP